MLVLGGVERIQCGGKLLESAIDQQPVVVNSFARREKVQRLNTLAHCAQAACGDGGRGDRAI